MRLHRILASALAAGLFAAAPAAAQQEEPEIPRPGPSYFFECSGPTKVQNLEASKSWSLEPPAQSFQEGAGCGTADAGVVRGTRSNTAWDASWGGRYAGPLEDMTIELHDLVLGQARLGQEMPLKVRLMIDGEEMLPAEDEIEVATYPEMSETGLTEKIVFSIYNIGLPALPFGMEREIIIDVGSPYIDYSHAFVWGASEIPAGVQINPEGKLKNPKIRI